MSPFGEGEEIISDNAQLELLRERHSKDLLLAHLNSNSLQNKFEELSAIIMTLRTRIMFVSETKIDASYPNAQFFYFSFPGYSLYRNNRKKEGGGFMALIFALEFHAFEIKTNTGNMVIIVIIKRLGKRKGMMKEIVGKREWKVVE